MKRLNKKEIKKFFKDVPSRTIEVVLVCEHIKYARNIASIFRTADAAGVSKLYLTGITHKPPFGKDLRKVSRNKEKSVHWQSDDKSDNVINKLNKEGFLTIAIEITDESVDCSRLPKILEGQSKVAFVVGNEVYGVRQDTLDLCDKAVYIPMFGKGGSLNVAVSAAVVLYSF